MLETPESFKYGKYVKILKIGQSAGNLVICHLSFIIYQN